MRFMMIRKYVTTLVMATKASPHLARQMKFLLEPQRHSLAERTIALGDKEAEQTLKLLDSLEELGDVQKAYTNADFSDEALNQYQMAS